MLHAEDELIKSEVCAWGVHYSTDNKNTLVALESHSEVGDSEIPFSKKIWKNDNVFPFVRARSCVFAGIMDLINRGPVQTNGSQS